jgi:hypothetical protein
MNEPNRLVEVILLVGLCVVGGCGSPSASNSGHFGWRQTDNSLALVSDGNVVWQLNYDRKEDKPYFHPVALTDGTVLTELRPPDHPWHRGLWWSWKFINRVNYWEDDPNTFLAPGRNEITDMRVKTHGDNSADVEIAVSYHPPGRPPVLTEKRLLKVGPPDKSGGYQIDWTSVFTAGDKNVLLDRTPILGEPQGVEWGGYAGLSVRLANSASGWKVVDSDGYRYGRERNNARARWLDYTIEAAGRPAGIAVLDHPSNLRHPTPWYVILGKDMRYFSPALLFYEPYTLPSGKTLTLHYRILIHPGRTDKDLMEKEWQKFSNVKW